MTDKRKPADSFRSPIANETGALSHRSKVWTTPKWNTPLFPACPFSKTGRKTSRLCGPAIIWTALPASNPLATAMSPSAPPLPTTDSNTPQILPNCAEFTPHFVVLTQPTSAPSTCSSNESRNFPAFGRPVSEMISWHDDLTNLTAGERPRANHPALARVCRFAGEYHLPVSIHHNIALHLSEQRRSQTALYPTNSFNSSNTVERATATADNLHLVPFGHQPAHCCKNLRFWIDEMLARYGDPLCIDLSEVFFPNYIPPNLDA